MPVAEFWYEFASTYSYPAAMRVAALAETRGVALAWRPFLLGPIFAAQGWRDSPFNIYPAKGRYMWRDLERICDALGLPLKRPEPFPQNSLLAARTALALEGDRRADFHGASIPPSSARACRSPIARSSRALLAKPGLDPDEVLGRAESDANKALLKAEGARAVELGIIGAPCLVTEDGEVFWGNDRLEQGLDWAAGRTIAGKDRQRPCGTPVRAEV